MNHHLSPSQDFENNMLQDLPEMTDAELMLCIKQEEMRQNSEINLIASENYVPELIRTITSSVLTNKYAEGYPKKRYYGGCQIVDAVEELAINRCKELFNAEHANVQPHSGSQANMIVYAALLEPGDTILGMSLNAGGHLTHGHGVNFSGKYYKSVQYGVNRDSELLDYALIEELAHAHKPKLIIAGASAYSRVIDFKKFAEIAKAVNAYFLVDMAHIAGLIAAGVHPSPLDYADMVSSTTHKTLRGPRGGFVLCKKEYAERLDRALIPGIQGGPLMHTIAAKATAFYLAGQPSFKAYQQQIVRNAYIMAQEFIKRGYRIVSGGTDNHLFIIDLTNRALTGLQTEKALEQAGIAVSRSCIPFDTQKPWITSGIRIGTPAVTTRGFNEKEVLELVDLIDTVLQNSSNTQVIKHVKQQTALLCGRFPLD